MMQTYPQGILQLNGQFSINPYFCAALKPIESNTSQSQPICWLQFKPRGLMYLGLSTSPVQFHSSFLPPRILIPPALSNVISASAARQTKGKFDSINAITNVLNSSLVCVFPLRGAPE